MNRSPSMNDSVVNLLSSPRTGVLNNSSPHHSLNHSYRSRSGQSEFMKMILEECIKDWFPFLKEDNIEGEGCDKKEDENKNCLHERLVRLQSYSIGVKSPEFPLQKLYKSDRNISHLNEDNEDEELFYSSFNIYDMILNETKDERGISESFHKKILNTKEREVINKDEHETDDEDEKYKDCKEEVYQTQEEKKEQEEVKANTNAEKETKRKHTITIPRKKNAREKESDREHEETFKKIKDKADKGYVLLQKQINETKMEHNRKYVLEQERDNEQKREKEWEREGEKERKIQKEKEREREREKQQNMNIKERYDKERVRGRNKVVEENNLETRNETAHSHVNNDNKKYKGVKSEKSIEKEETRFNVKEKRNVKETEKVIGSSKDKNNKIANTEKENIYEIKEGQKNITFDKDITNRIKHKSSKLSMAQQDARSISQILAEIKQEEANEKNVKMEHYGNMYMNICVRVLKQHPNFCLNASNLQNEQLKNEKKKIKEILKLYDKLFYSHFKFTPSNFYKESLRPIYSYYQSLKQNISQAENERVLADRKPEKPSGSEKKRQLQTKDTTSFQSISTSSSYIANNMNINNKEEYISGSASNNSILHSKSSNFSNLLNDPIIQKVIMDVDTCDDISHLEKDFKYIYKDLVKLKNLLVKKKYYKTILFNYQNHFLEKNNRCVKTYKDIYPVEKQYKLYTQIKKEICELITCINHGYKKYYKINNI